MIKNEPVTTRDGYDFLRWSEYKGTNTYLTVLFPFQTTSDLTLYAHWISKPKVVLEERNGELHCYRSNYEYMISVEENSIKWHIYYGISPSTETMSLLTTKSSKSAELTTDINPQEGYYYAVKLEVETIVECDADSFYSDSVNIFWKRTFKRTSDFSNVVQIGSSTSSGDTGNSSASSSADTSTTNPLEAPAITFGSDRYLSWNSISGATDYYIYYGSSSSTSSMSLRTTNGSYLTKIYVSSDYDGKYYSVRAYNSNTGKFSDYSNVVLIGSSSSSSSSTTSLITETITYTTNSELPGRYYINWTNSGNSVTSNPYLYLDNSWYGYPNNGSIQLSNGTHTFYLATSNGTRISNILTIAVSDSPYWYNHDN